jgi:type I restriction enzyme, S subunit
MARIGDVLQIQRRAVDLTPTEKYHEIGLRSFGRGIFHKEPISGSDLGDKRVFRINPGDLVVSNVFAWEGAIAIASEAERGFIGSHRFMTWTATSSSIDPSFAYHYFSSETGLEALRRASPGSAGRNRTLGVRAFEDLMIPLPDIAEQRAIADRLDRVAAQVVSAAASIYRGIDLRARLPKILEEVLARSTSELVAAGSLYTVINDLVHPGDDPTPASRFVGLEHIEPHTGRQLGASGVEGLTGRKFRFRAGDVLYGYLRPYQNKVWVADGDGLCSVEQFVLRPARGVDPNALAWSLRTSRTLDAAILSTNSLQLPRLSASQLANFRVYDAKGVSPEIRDQLEKVTNLLVKAAQLVKSRDAALKALPQAARNAEFARLMG